MEKDQDPKAKGPEVGSDIQRWTAKRKSAVVLDILKGLTTPAEVARQHNLTVAEVERWLEAGMRGMEDHLRSNPKDAESEWAEEKKDLYAKIGQLSLENDILKKTRDSLNRAIEEED